MVALAEQIANDFHESFEQLPPEKQQEVIESFDARSSTTDHNDNIQSRVMQWGLPGKLRFQLPYSNMPRSQNTLSARGSEL